MAVATHADAEKLLARLALTNPRRVANGANYTAASFSCLKRTQRALSLDWPDHAIAALAATAVSAVDCAGLNALVLLDVVWTPMPQRAYPFGLEAHEALRSLY